MQNRIAKQLRLFTEEFEKFQRHGYFSLLITLDVNVIVASQELPDDAIHYGFAETQEGFVELLDALKESEQPIALVGMKSDGSLTCSLITPMDTALGPSSEVQETWAKTTIACLRLVGLEVTQADFEEFAWLN